MIRRAPVPLATRTARAAAASCSPLRYRLSTLATNLSQPTRGEDVSQNASGCVITLGGVGVATCQNDIVGPVEAAARAGKNVLDLDRVRVELRRADRLAREDAGAVLGFPEPPTAAPLLRGCKERQIASANFIVQVFVGCLPRIVAATSHPPLLRAFVQFP